MSYKLNQEQAQRVIERIRKLIKQYFKENGITYAIFGKSEGLDSSVIAGLLSDIEGIKPIGVIIPIESDPEAGRIGKLVLDHYQIPSIRVELTQEYHFLMGNLYSTQGISGQLSNILKKNGDDQLLKDMQHRKPRANGNIKARLRMITLYHIAQLTGGVVVSTDNLSEFCMGFWTLNGDVGDIAPIQHIWKDLEEYSIAKALDVPDESINAVPTDGLDVIPGGTDEDQLGLPYHELDRVIISLLQNKFDTKVNISDSEIALLSNRLSDQLGYDNQKIAHVAHQMRSTYFKRNWPWVINRSMIGLMDIDKIAL